MRRLLPLVAALAFILTACATQKAETPPPPPEDTRLPYPHAIYVYDFATNPAETPGALFAATSFVGVSDDPETNEQREALERKIAGELAAKLVAALQELGLPAVRWAGTPPRNSDSYIIQGALVTTEGTDQLGVVVIGFAGKGAELHAFAQMTRNNSAQSLLANAQQAAVGEDTPSLTGQLAEGKKAGTASVITGVGIFKGVNNKLRAGAEATARAIVEQLKPAMQEQGWI